MIKYLSCVWHFVMMRTQKLNKTWCLLLRNSQIIKGYRWPNIYNTIWQTSSRTYWTTYISQSGLWEGRWGHSRKFPQEGKERWAVSKRYLGNFFFISHCCTLQGHHKTWPMVGWLVEIVNLNESPRRKGIWMNKWLWNQPVKKGSLLQDMDH